MMVSVEPIDEHAARGRTDHGNGGERGGIFGGRLVSQALAACAHTVPATAVPDSVHAHFFGGGRRGEPVEYRIDRVRDGRSLQHRDVRGYQGETCVVHAAVACRVPGEGADWQESGLPFEPPPHTGPDAPTAWAQDIGGSSMEIAYPRNEDRSTPWVPLWMRTITAEPVDAWLHGAVIAFWSDFGLNGAARDTQAAAGEPFHTLTVSHSLWIHRPSALHDWHILRARTRSIHGNQGNVVGTVHDVNGTLVASVAQGVYVMVRRAQ
jgi:acyl-CoA thioesterase-2